MVPFLSSLSLGESGFFWQSHAANDGLQANIFYITSEDHESPYYVNPYSANQKTAGWSVRCVSPGQTLSSITTMQEMSTRICEATAEGVAKSLIDERDGNTYSVIKLKDGNCWMQENLRLNLAPGQVFTSADTDLNSRSTWKPTVATQTSFDEYIAWGNYNTAQDDETTAVEHSYTNGDITVTDGDGAEWLAGNYYNWYTATAMSGTYDMVHQDAPDSICPVNWRLPRNSGDKSFENLFSNAYGIDVDGENAVAEIRKAPFSYIASGYYYAWTSGTGSSQTVGPHAPSALASWTTSYATTTNYRRRMRTNGTTGQIEVSNSVGRAQGLAVRCVAK